VEEPAEVVQVLHVQRLVKTEGLADLLDELRRGVLAEDGLSGVAGQEPEEQEQRDGQPEQHGDGPEHASEDVSQHERTRSS